MKQTQQGSPKTVQKDARRSAALRQNLLRRKMAKVEKNDVKESDFSPLTPHSSPLTK